MEDPAGPEQCPPLTSGGLISRWVGNQIPAAAATFRRRHRRSDISGDQRAPLGHPCGEAVPDR